MLRQINWVKVVHNIFFTLILLVAFLVVFSMFNFPGNFRLLVVQSGSMEPAIKTGSVIVVKPKTEYQVNDIITFGKISKTQTPTTHRIVEIKPGNLGNVYITKGDANNGPDLREVSQKEIIGTNRLAVPYLGYVVAFARTLPGFVALIMVPLVIIIYDEVRKIIGEVVKLRKGKGEKEKTY